MSLITFISFDASANGAHASAAVLPFGLLLGVQGNHDAAYAVCTLNKLYFRLIVRGEVYVTARLTP